eukprot:TRINITY_DN11984_c0_g3_i1.p1 TRINITY_DN11984_c0_g3~~TRINITY_DN11984_c0_g3_i1.p1  ORF type:complete len:585 (+),score=149.67 TRINITY_DN11984_c0_g3_i1:40-1794(+)
MAKFMLLLCVVALFSGVSFAEEEEDFVVTLGDDNLTSALEEDPDKIWLVEWYAPWCGHCKQLKPEYEEASRQLHSSTPSVALAAIDATVHSETAGEHDVQGYPTLKVFRNGKSYDYEGGRQAADIVSYMKKQASPDWKPPADRVVKLTNDNFDAFVDNEEIALVYFYAPWCGHCKQLTPEYEKAARDLYTNNPRIKLAKVDATEETELASRFDVTGYPTLKIFRKGEASDYEGERQQHAIVSEMKEQAQPPAKVINSVFDMDEFVKGDGDSVQLVAFLDDEAGSDADKWQRIASPLRKAYRFAISTSAAVRDKYKNAKPGRVVLFQPPKYHSKLEPAAVATELSKLATADDLSAWIEKRAVPLVGHRTRSSKYTGYNFAERMPQLVMYYKVDFGSALFKDTAYWRERLSTVAKDFSAINFMISDEEEFEQDLKDVGRLGSDDEFTVVLYDGSKRYLMEEDMEMDAVREFVEAYEEGELKPYIKSAPVPSALTDIKMVTWFKWLARRSKQLFKMTARMCSLRCMPHGVVIAKHWLQRMPSWLRSFAKWTTWSLPRLKPQRTMCLKNMPLKDFRQSTSSLKAKVLR